MKILIKTVFVIFLILASCSKKEGCRDADGLNYDPDAESDARCRYTQAIFYAPGDRVGGNGTRISRIEVYLGPTPGERLIGEITLLNQGSPNDCNPPEGGFAYELPGGGVEYIFLTRYFFEDNTNESGGSFTLQASRDQTCQLFSLTL